MRAPMTESLLSEQQASQYLGVSRSWLQKARCHGYGPAFVRLRKSGGIRYRITDLDAWLDRNTHGGREVVRC
jgi:predicted DNA-binding transcriptional regulator AlpA